MKRFLTLAILFALLLVVTVHAESPVPDDVEAYLNSLSQEELQSLVSRYEEKQETAENEEAAEPSAEETAETVSEDGDRKILFLENDIVLYKGTTLRPSPKVRKLADSAPDKTTLVWASSDPSVAKVSADGTISGVSRGQAQITCSAKDDPAISTTITVNVVIPVQKVTLDTTSATLTMHGDTTLILHASVQPEDAYVKDVSWESSDDSVATVEDGLVKAHKAGKVTITAVSKDTSGRQQKKASATITVGSAVQFISLKPDSLKLTSGRSATLTATVKPANAINKKVAWTSSNTSVATVSDRGVVTAVGNGECIIRCNAQDGGGATASVKVSVNTMISSIKIGKNAVTLTAGQSTRLSPQILPANATDKRLKWTSSDNSVASVNSDGKVIAYKRGTATITASAQDGSGKSARIKVNVNPVIPLEIKAVRIGWNSIGAPEVRVSVKNYSKTETIKAFTFVARCYDAYGTLLEAFGFGDTDQYFIWQDGKIKPGGSWTDWNTYWTMYGLENAYTIEVWLDDMITTNNRVIDVPYSDRIVWTWTR